MSNKFNIQEWQAKRLKEQLTTTDNDWKGLDAEVAKYIASTFATWMSPQSRSGADGKFVKNPPFSKEYAKAPYFDKLVEGIMDIVNTYEGEEELDEMNATGTGTSYQGTGMGHFGKNKKRKNDQI